MMNRKWIAFLLLATVAASICLYSPAAFALPPAPASSLASARSSVPIVQELYVVGERESSYRARVESYKFEYLNEIDTHMRLTVVLRYQNMLHKPCVPTDNINMMLVVENKYAYQFAFSNYSEPYDENVIYSEIVLDTLGEVDMVWVVDVPNIVANSMENRMLRYQLFKDVYISPLRPPKTAELGTPEQLAPDLLSPSAPTLAPVITAIPMPTGSLSIVQPQMTIPPTAPPIAMPTAALSISPSNAGGNSGANSAWNAAQPTYQASEREATPAPEATRAPATQAPKPTFALAPAATANAALATPLPTILPNLAF